MWPHMSWVEGDHLFPLPVGYILANAAQYALSLQCHKGTLVTHVQVVCEDPKGFFCKATFQSVFPGLYWCMGLFCLKCNRFLFADLHEGLVSPFLWLVKIPLNSSHGHQHIDYLFQLDFICGCDTVHCVLSLRSLVKAWNNVRPCTDQWGVLLITSHKLDFHLDTTWRSLLLESKPLTRTGKLKVFSNMVAPELSSCSPSAWRQNRLDPGGKITCYPEDLNVVFRMNLSVLNSFSFLVSYKAYFTLLMDEQRQEGMDFNWVI